MLLPASAKTNFWFGVSGPSATIFSMLLMMTAGFNVIQGREHWLKWMYLGGGIAVGNPGEKKDLLGGALGDEQPTLP